MVTQSLGAQEEAWDIRRSLFPLDIPSAVQMDSDPTDPTPTLQVIQMSK